MKRMIVLLIGLYFSGLTFAQVGGNAVQLDPPINLDARSSSSVIRGTSLNLVIFRKRNSIGCPAISKWQYISENSGNTAISYSKHFYNAI